MGSSRGGGRYRRRPGPEEFVNFHGLLVQSSNGLAPVQYSLVPELPVSQESSFSLVRGTVEKCLRSVRSVQFIQFSSRILPTLARIDLTGSVRLRLDLFHRVSNCLGRGGGSRRAALSPLQRKSQPAGPGLVAWVEGWCTLQAAFCLLVSE